MGRIQDYIDRKESEGISRVVDIARRIQRNLENMDPMSDAELRIFNSNLRSVEIPYYHEGNKDPNPVYDAIHNAVFRLWGTQSQLETVHTFSYNLIDKMRHRQMGEEEYKEYKYAAQFGPQDFFDYMHDRAVSEMVEMAFAKTFSAA